MAHRTQPLTLAGGAAAAFVAVLVGGSLVAVLSRAEGASLASGDWSAVRFTLWQAAVSAVLSVGLAVPVARALARRRFAGRGALITLLGAPFILPVIVAILGLLMVFGRAGWANEAGAALGLPRVSIYGAHGVILAHVFFNLPLATRLVLQGWQAIPALSCKAGRRSRPSGSALRRRLACPGPTSRVISNGRCCGRSCPVRHWSSF